jgi:replicative DNA helicase Mcm
MDAVGFEVDNKEYQEINITEDDIKEFETLAKTKGAKQKIAKSIAPSIFGFDEIKEALAHQLFGGTLKELPDGSRIRGDPVAYTRVAAGITAFFSPIVNERARITLM